MDPRYVSLGNRAVPPARPGEFAPLSIGPLAIAAPVVLAPMAGITNPPFRTLCRGFGAGLYVSEMITARALVERNAKTLRLAGFDPSEKPRSLQLYAVDEHYTREAVRWLVGEDLVDHIDLNFGCPVPKVTRRGGGSALPWKRELFRRVVAEAARLLANEPEYGAWAWEVHHSAKKDAPSGTLLQLVEEMKRAGYTRQIDASSNRAGANPGTHEIGFDSTADTITLRHSARSREGFARGALKAAQWVIGKRGLHEFGEVIFAGDAKAMRRPAD